MVSELANLDQAQGIIIIISLSPPKTPFMLLILLSTGAMQTLSQSGPALTADDPEGLTTSLGRVIRNPAGRRGVGIPSTWCPAGYNPTASDGRRVREDVDALATAAIQAPTARCAWGTRREGVRHRGAREAIREAAEAADLGGRVVAARSAGRRRRRRRAVRPPEAEHGREYGELGGKKRSGMVCVMGEDEALLCAWLGSPAAGCGSRRAGSAR